MGPVRESLAKAVFELLCQHETLRAVALVRRELATGLKEAIAIVKEVRADCFTRVEGPGMSLSILGVGPLHDSVVSHLDYGPAMYDHVPQGTTVCAQPFELYAAPVDVVRRVCSALGVDDVADLNQHPLDGARVDFDALVWVLADYWSWDQTEAEEDCEGLRILARHGFRLFLRVDDWSISAQRLVPKEELPWG